MLVYMWAMVRMTCTDLVDSIKEFEIKCCYQVWDFNGFKSLVHIGLENEGNKYRSAMCKNTLMIVI